MRCWCLRKGLDNMCVIACKPAGVPFPTMDTLKNCWESNPQGAGIAWQQGKRVRIEKGMMTWEAFEAYAEKLHKAITPDVAVMYHFRITSRGEKSAAQCHPYPLERDDKRLNALSLRTDCAVAHNGTMPMTCAKGMNDTQTFIKYYLTHIADLCPDWLNNPVAKTLASNIAESKLAVLKDNVITTMGDFIEDNGMLYSNDGYMPHTYSRYWDDEDFKYPSQAKPDIKPSTMYKGMSTYKIAELIGKECAYVSRAFMNGTPPFVSPTLFGEAMSRVNAYYDAGTPKDMEMEYLGDLLDELSDMMGWM